LARTIPHPRYLGVSDRSNISSPTSAPLGTSNEFFPPYYFPLTLVLPQVFACLKVGAGKGNSTARGHPAVAPRIWRVRPRQCRTRRTRGTSLIHSSQSTHLHVIEQAVTGKEVIFGYDTSGRPGFYMFPSRQNTDDPTRQIQFVVWMLERCNDLMGPGVE